MGDVVGRRGEKEVGFKTEGITRPQLLVVDLVELELNSVGCR